MITKFMTTASIVAALALVPAQEAEADAAEFIGGAILGGVIVHALNQGNRTTTTTTRVVRPSIPVTQQGRETQIALNYFGFQAGSVDGQVGPGTRSAIERYQRAMGYPVDGREFSSYQFDYLMDAYFWAQNGGSAQTALTGQPLFFAYRNGMQGLTQPATTPAPNLFSNPAPTASLANTCNSVMLRTSTNGGYITLATMNDPGAALSEQFCVARTYAMAQGEQLMQSIIGMTQAQIVDECRAFAARMTAEVDRASLVAHTVLEQEMRQFAASTGISNADLAATAQVCLSVGYTLDDMRMAIGSALTLIALGEPAYGELLGHHLREGFGTVTRPDLAMGWYDATFTALELGAMPAFMPGQPERVQLLRQATLMLQGGAPIPAPVPVVQPVPAPVQNGLPTFTVSQ